MTIPGNEKPEIRAASIPGIGEVRQIPDGTDIEDVELKDGETVASIPTIGGVAVLERQNLQATVTPAPATVPPPESISDAAAAVAGGNPAKAEALIHVAENVGTSIPESGAARYVYIAEGIKQFAKENPEIQSSNILQFGYALALLFGRLGGFSADADAYASFIDAWHGDETMSESEMQKYLDKKYKDEKRVSLRDSYFKCEKELKENQEKLDKDKKNADLKFENDYLTRKLALLKEKINPTGDVMPLSKEELEAAGAEYNKGIDKNELDALDKLEGSADSMASVAYVSRILGITVDNNDPDRLYAKLMHAKYFKDPNKPEVTHSLYYRTPATDVPTLVKRAKAQTLPVNTVIFFSKMVGNESIMMAGIVGYDGNIHYHDREKLTPLPGDSLDKFFDPESGVQFKGSFEAEESQYNTEIRDQIETEKEKAKAEADAKAAAAAPAPASGAQE